GDSSLKNKNSLIFFSERSSSKVEEACDLYVRAANMFKMAKNWSAAGDAFCKAAQLHLQVQSKHNAAVNFLDAGNAFKKADPQEAISCFCQATDIYTDMGRFNIAAKHHISIAEIYESELLDIDKAISHYEQAADYYKGEESNSVANKCLLKVATYAAQMEQYQKSIEIFEQIGTYSMDTTLLRYGAKDDVKLKSLFLSVSIILLIFQILCLIQGCRLLLQGSFQSLLFLHTGVQGLCDFRPTGVLILGWWENGWGVCLSNIFHPPTNVYVSKLPEREQKNGLPQQKTYQFDGNC
uniref:N-ethylmaleimide-sensitive factor attachment protein, alpha a n=1 Tax=Sinocyclocheilus grahami TaxID=75366 RepID=A0A672K8Y7_SINGR